MYLLTHESTLTALLTHFSAGLKRPSSNMLPFMYFVTLISLCQLGLCQSQISLFGQELCAKFTAENCPYRTVTAKGDSTCYQSLRDLATDAKGYTTVLLYASVDAKSAIIFSASRVQDSSVSVIGCAAPTVITCGENQAVGLVFTSETGMKVQVGSLTVTGCAVSGIVAREADVTLSNVTIENCGNLGSPPSKLKLRAEDQLTGGGGVYVLGNLTMAGCMFRNNKAMDGGAAYVDDEMGTLALSDCTFSGNSAKRWGGGVYTKGNSTIGPRVVFSNNTARSGGGVFAAAYANVTGASFSGNVAMAVDGDAPGALQSSIDLSGGALSAAVEANISNCTFSANTATEQGGAIVLADVATVVGSSFFNNTANIGGGIDHLKSLNVSNCEFRYNVGNIRGGGITGLNLEATLMVVDSFFQQNTALGSRGGGAISTENNNVELVGSTFFANEVKQDSAESPGAAVSGYSTDLLVAKRCNFTANQGIYATIYVLGVFVLEDSIMARNKAVMDSIVNCEGSINVTRSVITGNFVEKNAAGGTFMCSGDINGVDSIFTNNTAILGAGAMCNGQCTYRNCTVSRNKNNYLNRGIGMIGASLHAGTQSITVENCFIDSNEGYNGAGVSSVGEVTSTGTVFRGNVAVKGSAIRSQGRVNLGPGNVFLCNVAKALGSAVYAEGSAVAGDNMTLHSNVDEARRNCPFAGQDGFTCKDDSYDDYCQCEFTQTNDTCGAPNSQCVSAPNTALGYQCSCTAPGLWAPQGLGCRPCASCGDGSQLAACTATADTQCACPANRTGNNCAQPCALPPACLAADPTTPCTFDAANPAKGVRCLQCKADHFVNSQGLCQKCSTCGSAGTLTANCTATADTVCLCPPGKTGNDCDMDCRLPPGCINTDMASIQACGFDRSTFYLGVKCLTCDDKYYLSNDTCFPATVCNSTQYETQSPTTTTDRVCSQCTVIPNCANLQNCTTTADARCLECATGYTGSLCEIQTSADPNSSSSSKTTSIIVGTVVGGVALAAAALLFAWYHSHKNLNKAVEKAVEERIKEIRKNHEWADAGTSKAHNLLMNVKTKNGTIDRSQFALLEQLGAGAFGTVYRGVVFSGGNAVECAIKTTTQQDEAVRAEFLREAELIKHLDHDNVVSTVGVCMEESGELYLLLEFMPLGDLRGYIKKNPDTSTLTRTWFACEMAAGFAFLAGQGIIHRDIAARNILLAPPRSDSYGQPTAKVSDLGLARVAGAESQMYVKTDTAGALLPVRWMAPEAVLDGTYSSATDVWSYGVAVWETFSGGEMPFDFLQSASQIIQAIRHGVRLLRPTDMPEELYSLLLCCWDIEPANRPTFATLEEETLRIFHELRQQEESKGMPQHDPARALDDGSYMTLQIPDALTNQKSKSPSTLPLSSISVGGCGSSERTGKVPVSMIREDSAYEGMQEADLALAANDHYASDHALIYVNSETEGEQGESSGKGKGSSLSRDC